MSPKSTFKRRAAVIIIYLFCCSLSSFAQPTVSALWADYVANPYNHPNIPNNSYAGYGTGTVSIPNPAYTVYNVTAAPYNAVPGDINDDQPAIQSAIDAAGAAGSGIVYLPAGTYYLNKPVYIKYNNVIVRGAGSTGASATILDFRYSMYSMFKADIDASDNPPATGVGPGWVWWSTGLVWIGPANTFKANGAPDMIRDYEQWRGSSTLATITQVSNPGSFSITVNNASSLSAGMRVLLRYQMPADRSLIKEIHGHTATKPGIDNDAYVGDCTNIKAPGETNYDWPAVIKKISGNTVTFDRPLRIKVDPVLWPATLQGFNGMITESGIENVKILGHNVNSMGHLVTPTSNATGGGTSLGGWNGIYINRSWNCWANNIRFENLECGVVLAAAKNCSVLNTFVTSSTTTRWYHHPFAIRVCSSDNLIENFTIDGPNKVYHGINAEWYSSGNVYSKGLMKVGTFDSHRGSPFDQIRTEIVVENDAGSAPGGAATSGPFAGKRFAHWNITQVTSGRGGEDIYEPKQFPMGALVAITGTRNTSNGESVPPGDLGTIETTGAIPDPGLDNLYHAQLALRNLITLPIHLINFNILKTADSKAKVTWTVAEPENDDKLVVQWSNDGINFSDINYQYASAQQTDYYYEHRVDDWNSTQYYRLKIVPVRGAVFYSVVKTIRPERQTDYSFSIFPNPVKNKLKIHFSNLRPGDLQYIRIMNGSGQVVKVINTEGLLNNQQMVIDLQYLPSAHYFIEAVSKYGVYKKSFIRQ